MKPSILARGLTGLYLLAFFTFLFGPLFIMVVTALNSSSFPRISPWDCLTFEWFAKLAADERLQTGLLTGAVPDPDPSVGARQLLYADYGADPDSRRGSRHLHPDFLGSHRANARFRDRQLLL
jgi:hypothetical protein